MTTLEPSGTSRSAAGTEVSRPEGSGTATRPDRGRPDEAATGPGPHQRCAGADGRRRRQGCGTGTECRAHLVPRVPSGTGGRRCAGSRRGSVVGLGSSSGTDGSPGDRVRVPPHGAAFQAHDARRSDVGGGSGTRKRLRGVDRFAGRLLGAVLRFPGRARRGPAAVQGTYSPSTASAVMPAIPAAATTGTRRRSGVRSATAANATTNGNPLRA